MKRISYLLLFVSLLTACHRSTKVPVSYSKARITFETDEHNFGDSVIHHEPQTYDFVFHNAGATPLVIYKAEGSCFCTQATYDKDPIQPGEEGVIHVTYLANNGTGHFLHYVAVYSNGADSTGVTSLRIEGAVREK